MYNQTHTSHVSVSVCVCVEGVCVCRGWGGYMYNQTHTSHVSVSIRVVPVSARVRGRVPHRVCVCVCVCVCVRVFVEGVGVTCTTKHIPRMFR